MTHETACVFPKISLVDGYITQQVAAPYLSCTSRWGIAPEVPEWAGQLMRPRTSALTTGSDDRHDHSRH